MIFEVFATQDIGFFDSTILRFRKAGAYLLPKISYKLNLAIPDKSTGEARKTRCQPRLLMVTYEIKKCLEPFPENEETCMQNSFSEKKRDQLPGCGLIMRDHSARAECAKVLGPKSENKREASLT